MLITAETITDEQIRELRSWAERIVDLAGFALLAFAREIKSPTLLAEAKRARVECARVLNARAAASAAEGK